jgi:ribosome-binding protein aMBF1 (putative translation factor)
VSLKVVSYKGFIGFIILAIYGINQSKYKPLLDLSNMSSLEKKELLKKVGKRVQELRASKGMKQIDLASKIQGDIDTTNISRIESGRTNPTIYTLYRIAEALDISMVDLLQIEQD